MPDPFYKRAYARLRCPRALCTQFLVGAAPAASAGAAPAAPKPQIRIAGTYRPPTAKE